MGRRLRRYSPSRARRVSGSRNRSGTRRWTEAAGFRICALSPSAVPLKCPTLALLPSQAECVGCATFLKECKRSVNGVPALEVWLLLAELVLRFIFPFFFFFLFLKLPRVGLL